MIFSLVEKVRKKFGINKGLLAQRKKLLGQGRNFSPTIQVILGNMRERVRQKKLILPFKIPTPPPPPPVTERGAGAPPPPPGHSSQRGKKRHSGSLSVVM